MKLREIVNWKKLNLKTKLYQCKFKQNMKIKSNQNSGFGKLPKQELEVEKIFKLFLGKKKDPCEPR